MNPEDNDITDILDAQQMAELISLASEDADDDVITETDFRKMFARWSC